MSPLPRPYLSIPEVLQVLQICKATFYEKLVNTGRIKLFKIGRRSFVKIEELERFVKANDN